MLLGVLSGTHLAALEPNGTSPPQLRMAMSSGGNGGIETRAGARLLSALPFPLTPFLPNHTFA